MQSKKIAVLTSGGDAQGMNCAISILTRLAISRGYKIYGILEGYKGLYNDFFVELTLDKVENIESLGGTILKTSRFLEFKQKEVISRCVENIKRHNLDAIIIIGGDGSFAGAMELVKEGVRVICIPATVDNDLRYTENCLGFDSAVNNVCDYIHNVKQTMSSMNRGVVFEVMGRYCGDIALYSACATACDIVAVPEKKDSEEDIITKAIKCINEKHHMPTIVVAEKLFDVKKLTERLTTATRAEFKYSLVGYIQRGGEPSVLDKSLAMQFSVKAIDLIEKGLFNMAIAKKGKNVTNMPLIEALKCDYDFNYELLNLFYALNE